MNGDEHIRYITVGHKVLASTTLVRFDSELYEQWSTMVGIR
jgi:hypothetical protein